MKTTKPNIHPLLGVDLNVWNVLQYPATVELRNRVTKQIAAFAKPTDRESPEWWLKQAAKAIAELNSRLVNAAASTDGTDKHWEQWDKDWKDRIISSARRFKQCVRNTDILFWDELSGPDGVHVFVIQEQHHTDSQIENAKEQLKADRDVTGFTVIKAGGAS